MKEGHVARRLDIEVLRYDPREPGVVPRMQRYEIEESEGMTLFIALTEIRERLDPSLCFDFVCRAGVCGSCGMLIDGRPGLACRTLTRDLGTRITLAPLPGFALIADLSVNTGKWMRALAERIYELDRCIECGCCMAACGTARMRPDFIGAAGLDKIARFRLDPRDERDDADYYELVGDDSGVFGCMSLLACHDVCPKGLPLRSQIAYVRRKLSGRANVRVRVCDAARPGGDLYDGVCCFFLLHEVPEDHRRKVVRALLQSLKPGGRAVFVDYHRPAALHPVRPVMAAVFRWLEPYASSFIARPIESLAADATQFDWTKTTCFGGWYQKVVVRRRMPV
jgi:fumarate reductase iron-sulfur subunit